MKLGSDVFSPLQTPVWTDTVSDAKGSGSGLDICGPRTCVKTTNESKAFYDTNTLNTGTGRTDLDSDIE